MNDEFAYVPEMRHFQPLWSRYRDRPDWLAVLQSQFGLVRVNASNTMVMPAESAMQMSEWLHGAGDPHAVAWLASQLDMGAGHGLVYYLRAHDTLEQALQVVFHLGEILFPDGEFHWGVERGVLRLVMRPSNISRLGLLLRYEGLLVWLSRVISDVTGQALSPLHASVVSPSTTSAPQLASMLGVQPRMSANACVLEYPETVLALHLPGASPTLRNALAAVYEQRLSAQQKRTGVVYRVAHWISTQPQLREVRIETAAVALAMGTSTLRRQLAAHDTQFSSLLSAHRFHVAMQALLGSEDKTEAIAQQVGYAERSAFERAFRDHYGITPAQCRKAAQELLGSARLGDWNSPSRWHRHSPRLAWLRAALRDESAHTSTSLCSALQADPVLVLRLLGYCGQARYGGLDTCTFNPALLERMHPRIVRNLVESFVPAVDSATAQRSLHLWRQGALASAAVRVLAAQCDQPTQDALALAAWAHNLGQLLAGRVRGEGLADGNLDSTWLLLASWNAPSAVLHWLRMRHTPSTREAQWLDLSIRWAHALLQADAEASKSALQALTRAGVGPSTRQQLLSLALPEPCTEESTR